MGKDAVSGMPAMDPAEMFGMLFGSDLFEEYVGQRGTCIAAPGTVVNSPR